MSKKKKEVEIRSWIVPMEYRLRGQVIVDAETADRAKEIVNGGIFDEIEAGAELTDWKITGEPELNE